MSVGKQSVPSTRSSSRQSFVFQHYDGGYAQATSRPGTSSSRHSHSGSSVTSHTPPSPLSSGMSHGSSLPSSHSVHDPDELDLLMQQNGQQPFPHTFGYGPPRPDAGFDFPYGHAREEVNQYMTHGIETMVNTPPCFFFCCLHQFGIDDFPYSSVRVPSCYIASLLDVMLNYFSSIQNVRETPNPSQVLPSMANRTYDPLVQPLLFSESKACS